jgi:alpha/beta superfamily hydrolase
MYRFDFSGNGESEGHFKFANYVGEVEDIRAAKQFLEQQEGQKVVGLLGEHVRGVFGWTENRRTPYKAFLQ